jgi:hypothetical protein
MKRHGNYLVNTLGRSSKADDTVRQYLLIVRDAPNRGTISVNPKHISVQAFLRQLDKYGTTWIIVRNVSNVAHCEQQNNTTIPKIKILLRKGANGQIH